MTEDEHEAQSKLTRPAPAAGPGLPADTAGQATPDAAQAKGENSASAPLTPGPMPVATPVAAPSPVARPIAGPAVAPPAPASAPAFDPALEGDEGGDYDDDELDDDELDEDADLEADEDLESEESLTLGERLRRVSPALVTMAVGSIGSAIFLLFAVTSHTTPVSVLLTAAVVTGLIFLLDSIVSFTISIRAALSGRSGRSLGFALLFGISSVGCAVSFAALAILLLTLGY